MKKLFKLKFSLILIVLTVFLSQSVLAQDTTTAHFWADESSGTELKGTSIPQINGTVTSSSIWTPSGKINGAMANADTYWGNWTNPSPCADWSFATWVKMDSYQVNSGLLSRTANNLLYLSFTGTTILDFNTGGGNPHLFTVPDMDDAAWHQVILTVDSGVGIRMWVDNTESVTGTLPYTGAPTLPAEAIDIGARSNLAPDDFEFPGTMDDIRFYCRVINVSERTRIWNGGAGIQNDAVTAKTITPTFIDVDPVNESIITELTLNISTTGYNVSSGGGAFVEYNGTNYISKITSLSTGVGGFLAYKVNVSTPVVEVNNSQITYTWFYNVTVNVSDVISLNGSSTQNIVYAFPRVNISADSIISGGAINNFSGTVTKSTTKSYSTTSGSSFVRLDEGLGDYELFIIAPGFAVNNDTNFQTFQLNLTTPIIYNVNFDLYTNNSVNFSVFNVSNNNLVNDTTTIIMSGETITYVFTTTNGTIYRDNLNDDIYRTTIENPSYDTTTIYLTMSNSSYLPVNVFLEQGTVSKTFITKDTFGVAVQDATITFFRNVNGTFVTAAQEITDFSGRATVSLKEDIVYRMVVVASGFDTFTGNVQPTETEYTITLTATALVPFISETENLVWTTVYTQNIDNLYNTFIINSVLGELEYFGVNTSYNGVEYFTNTTASPAGGQINFNITPFAFDNQTFIVYDYWFKTSTENEQWSETYNLNPYNVTNITFTGGLFSDLEALPNTDPIKGLIGAMIIIFFVVVLGGTAGSATIGVIGGIIGLGVNQFFGLLPNSILTVSLVVCLILLIADNVGGGR